MKPKILYWLAKAKHKRVFLPLIEDDRVEQAIAMPETISAKGFNLKVLKYATKVEKVINKYKPDIFIQCDTSFDIPILKEKNILHGYIHHGIWAKSPVNLNRVSNQYWMNFDLLCGGTNMFKEIFDGYSTTNAIIATNALPQFDNLYHYLQDQKTLKQHIIASSKNTSAQKVITLFSHACKYTETVSPYNAGYYSMAVEMAKLAEKHNWLIIIKPKSAKVEKFILESNESWAIELRASYMGLRNNKYVKFVSPDDNPYKYFCADLLVCTVSSSIEVEAAIAGKPLVRVRAVNRETSKAHSNLEIGALDFGAAYVVSNTGKRIESTLLKALYGDNSELFEGQNRFVERLGVTFDGKAHVRLLDSILKALEKKTI